MSQIFISYASEDRPWVEPFAKTLEKQGWSVWWDRRIPTGHTYDDVIWRALQEAKCVVVVWSRHSIESEWVKEEASDAKKRNILLPVRIEEARPPFGFSRRQTQSLVGWQDGISHQGYDQLLTDIAHLLKTPPPVLSAGGSATLARIHAYLWLIIPTASVMATVLALMAWRVPTHVQLDLTVDRVEFTVGHIEGGSMSLLGPLEFQALTIREFSRIAMSPKTAEVADPRFYDFDTDTYPSSAWHALTSAGESLEMLAGESSRHPTITLKGGKAADSAGRLNSVGVASLASVAIKRSSGSGASLTVDIHAAKPRAVVLPAPTFQIAARHITLKGATLPPFAQPDGQTYRVSLKTSLPTVEVDGGVESLGLTVRPVVGSDLFRMGQTIPVTAIEFAQQGANGGRTTSLTEGAEAVLTYPDVPDLPKVQFKAPDSLGLEALERFVIKEIEWSAADKGIRLTLDGVAGHVATKPGEFTRDHRLTQFEKLRHNPSLMTVLAILGWVVPTLIGARKLFKELR